MTARKKFTWRVSLIDFLQDIRVTAHALKIGQDGTLAFIEHGKTKNYTGVPIRVIAAGRYTDVFLVEEGEEDTDTPEPKKATKELGAGTT